MLASGEISIEASEKKEVDNVQLRSKEQINIIDAVKIHTSDKNEDVIIFIMGGGQSLNFSRSVLCLASPLLDKLVGGLHSCYPATILLPTFPPSSLTCLVTLLTTGTTGQPTLSRSELQNIRALASQLGIQLSSVEIHNQDYEIVDKDLLVELTVAGAEDKEEIEMTMKEAVVKTGDSDLDKLLNDSLDSDLIGSAEENDDSPRDIKLEKDGGERENLEESINGNSVDSEADQDAELGNEITGYNVMSNEQNIPEPLVTDVADDNIQKSAVHGLIDKFLNSFKANASDKCPDGEVAEVTNETSTTVQSAAKVEDMNSVVVDGKYRCIFCHSTYIKPRGLLEHSAQEHFKEEIQVKFGDLIRRGRCSLCNKRVRSGSVSQHLGSTHRKVNEMLVELGLPPVPEPEQAGLGDTPEPEQSGPGVEDMPCPPPTTLTESGELTAMEGQTGDENEIVTEDEQNSIEKPDSTVESVMEKDLDRAKFRENEASVMVKSLSNDCTVKLVVDDDKREISAKESVSSSPVKLKFGRKTFVSDTVNVASVSSPKVDQVRKPDDDKNIKGSAEMQNIETATPPFVDETSIDVTEPNFENIEDESAVEDISATESLLAVTCIENLKNKFEEVTKTKEETEIAAPPTVASARTVTETTTAPAVASTPAVNYFNCPLCIYIVDKKATLREHLSKVHYREMLLKLFAEKSKCLICRKTYLDTDHLVRHIGHNHKKLKEITTVHCKVYSVDSSKPADLSATYPCGECGKCRAAACSRCIACLEMAANPGLLAGVCYKLRCSAPVTRQTFLQSGLAGPLKQESLAPGKRNFEETAVGEKGSAKKIKMEEKAPSVNVSQEKPSTIKSPAELLFSSRVKEIPLKPIQLNLGPSSKVSSPKSNMSRELRRELQSPQGGAEGGRSLARPAGEMGCYKCSQSYRTRSDLYEHYSIKHFYSHIIKTFKPQNVCPIPSCNLAISGEKIWICHVGAKHNIVEGFIPKEHRIPVIETQPVLETSRQVKNSRLSVGKHDATLKPVGQQKDSAATARERVSPGGGADREGGANTGGYKWWQQLGGMAGLANPK